MPSSISLDCPLLCVGDCMCDRGVSAVCIPCISWTHQHSRSRSGGSRRLYRVRFQDSVRVLSRTKCQSICREPRHIHGTQKGMSATTPPMVSRQKSSSIVTIMHAPKESTATRDRSHTSWTRPFSTRSSMLQRRRTHERVRGGGDSGGGGGGACD